MRDLQRRSSNQRSVEVPIEVTLSSDEDPVHIPAVEYKPECNFVDSTTSQRDVPEIRDVPLESTPTVRIPRLTREQFAAMWTVSSSSSEEEEDEEAQQTLPGGGQSTSSPAPGDMRLVSNMSLRYHPSTPLGDRMSDTKESSEATPPAPEDEAEAGPSRQ